ncbi:MAG: gamma-glutamyltransferase, partial [Pseudomonadota bacterium]
MRDFGLPGRSPAVGGTAMIATSHTMASAAGLDVLRAGGSAVDAALTAAALLCVVEPQMTGIGGDSFALVATPDGTVEGMSGTGRAPQAAARDAVAQALSRQGCPVETDGYGHTKIPRHTAHAVTVPGALAGWAALHERYGTMPWATLFEPAIRAAKEGFPVASRVASDWA